MLLSLLSLFVLSSMIYSPVQFLRAFVSLLERHAEANAVQILFLSTPSEVHDENRCGFVDDSSLAVSVKKNTLLHIQVQFGIEYPQQNCSKTATDKLTSCAPSARSLSCGGAAPFRRGKTKKETTPSRPFIDNSSEISVPSHSSFQIMTSYHVVGSHQHITMYWCSQLQRLFCTRALLLHDEARNATHSPSFHAGNNGSRVGIEGHSSAVYPCASDDLFSSTSFHSGSARSVIFRVDLPGIIPSSPMVWNPQKDGFFGSHFYYTQTVDILYDQNGLQASTLRTNQNNGEKDVLSTAATTNTNLFPLPHSSVNDLPKSFPVRMAIVLNASLPSSDTHLVTPGYSLGVSVLHAPSLHLCTADCSLPPPSHPPPTFSRHFSSTSASGDFSGTVVMDNSRVSAEVKEEGNEIDAEKKCAMQSGMVGDDFSNNVTPSSFSSSNYTGYIPYGECGKEIGTRTNRYSLDSYSHFTSNFNSSSSSVCGDFFNFMKAFISTHILPRVDLRSSVGATWRDGEAWPQMKDVATAPYTPCASDRSSISSSAGLSTSSSCLSSVSPRSLSCLEKYTSATQRVIQKPESAQEENPENEKKNGVYGIGNFVIADFLAQHQHCSRVHNIILLLDVPLQVWHSLYWRCVQDTGRRTPFMPSLRPEFPASPLCLVRDVEVEEMASKIAASITTLLGRVAAKNMDMFAFSRIKQQKAPFPLHDSELPHPQAFSAASRVRSAYTNDMLRHSIAESITKMLFASSNAKFVGEAQRLLWGPKKTNLVTATRLRGAGEIGNNEIELDDEEDTFPCTRTMQARSHSGTACKKIIWAKSYSEVSQIIEERLRMKSE